VLPLCPHTHTHTAHSSRLVQELREATPTDWEDYATLQQAVEEINGTVKGANETKRVTDDLYKIVELQNRFMTCSGELAQLHKHEFVMETPCRRLSRGKLKKGNLFLFADMLVVAKTKGQKFDAVLIVSAPNLVVTDDVDSSTSPSRSLARCYHNSRRGAHARCITEYKNALAIATVPKKTEKHIVSFKTPADKALWAAKLVPLCGSGDA